MVLNTFPDVYSMPWYLLLALAVSLATLGLKFVLITQLGKRKRNCKLQYDLLSL